MRALFVPAAGEQPIVSDLPTPVPGEGQVLIRVRAAALNAVDNAIAAGMMAEMIPHEYPLVLGRDAAGVVEAVGPGVTEPQVGDEIFGHVLLAPPVQAGTLAEYALLPAAAVAPKPADLDFATAAAIPLAGAAAVACIDAINPQAGQTVLVSGATGGVGSFAVQLLARRGVTVIATGTVLDADRLRTLGAAEIVGYTTGSVADQVLAAYPGGVDALVNLAGFTTADIPLAAVRQGGAVATTTGAPDQEALSAAGLTGATVMANPVSEVTATLAAAAAAGDLTVEISQILTLDQAAEGLATIASGAARSKMVVSMDR